MLDGECEAGTWTYEAVVYSGSASFRGHSAKVGKRSSLLKSGKRDMTTSNHEPQNAKVSVDKNESLR